MGTTVWQQRKQRLQDEHKYEAFISKQAERDQERVSLLDKSRQQQRRDKRSAAARKRWANLSDAAKELKRQKERERVREYRLRKKLEAGIVNLVPVETQHEQSSVLWPSLAAGSIPPRTAMVDGPGKTMLQPGAAGSPSSLLTPTNTARWAAVDGNASRSSPTPPQAHLQSQAPVGQVTHAHLPPA